MGSKQSTSKLAARKNLPPHRRRCIIIKDAKHRGEWTELNFMSRVTERGFNVSKPWGDSCRYDVAVERGGKFLRVQVKSTIARQDGGYIVTIKSGYHYYTSHQVDFFAIYVIREDVWYILPAKIITILRSNFLLAPAAPPKNTNPTKKPGICSKRDARCLLRAPMDKPRKLALNGVKGGERLQPTACPELVEGT